MYLSLFLLSFLLFFPSLSAQSIFTTTPVPPLQWINLSPLLQGSNAPPALKDPAIGYDDYSRTLIIFGGESQAGFPQSQTYLLNLDSLTWSSPTPPSGLTQAPPSRSGAIAGIDIAANYRHGFVVIGGKGDQGVALSDVWEFDFSNQFWSSVSISPGGPSARWGSSGGIDTRSVPIQDPRLASPNNTFYLVGGTDGSQSSSLSDIWRFNITGSLSANLQNSVGSWDHLTIGNLPAKVGQGGTIAYNQIVTVGGCNASTGNSSACAQQDSYVIAISSNNIISPAPCPAPRYGPALVPNMNGYTSSFSSQVFVLSGLYDSSVWNVGNITNDGEIGVLDINAGTWTRVLPSGDPGTNNSQASYPVAREGAAAVVYPNGLVGQNRATSSDIIVFGGQDATGRYLSDLWLLRSFNASVTPSSPVWPGYGNGQLQTGVNADGSGVRMQFPSQCATRIITTGTSGNSSSSSPPKSSGSTHLDPDLIYNTSVIHKILAPLSVALLLPAVMYYRLTLATYTDKKVPERHLRWFIVPAALTFLACAMAIVGLVTSFTFISSSKPSTHKVLPTTHSRAGLAFFACLYVIFPALFIIHYFLARSVPSLEDGRSDGTERRITSLDVEKPSSLPGHISSSGATSPSSSPRTRSQSFGPMMRGKTAEGAVSTDSESITSAGPHRAFEVLNRPPRNRPSSGGWAQAYAESPRPLNPRSLGDVDWLLRRRSLNAVDELDYAITQLHNARRETPATTYGLIKSRPDALQGTIRFPPCPEGVIHILLQASLLGISVVSLIELWSRGYKLGFAIFLVWSALFYVVLIALSWFGCPEKSVLSATLHRLRGGASNSAASDDRRPRPQSYPLSTHEGPYLHQPVFHVATREELSYARPLSVTTDDDDDNIDEGTRQRMIEEEMERRDVSIVTVPRRRLLVANPS
jgi:hypothetical protein